MKISLSDSEILGLESQSSLKIKIKNKKTLAKYVALPASLPSRLNKQLD